MLGFSFRNLMEIQFELNHLTEDGVADDCCYTFHCFWVWFKWLQPFVLMQTAGSQERGFLFWCRFVVFFNEQHQNAHFNYFRNTAVAQGCWVSRSHRGTSQKDIAFLAWKQDQQPKMQVCGGWTAQAAHVPTPTLVHVRSCYVILCLWFEKVNSHSLFSMLIIKMCSDPSTGSPLCWRNVMSDWNDPFDLIHVSFMAFLPPAWPGIFHFLEPVRKEMHTHTCTCTFMHTPLPAVCPCSWVACMQTHTYVTCMVTAEVLGFDGKSIHLTDGPS